jgi:hypothetical protein
VRYVCHLSWTASDEFNWLLDGWMDGWNELGNRWMDGWMRVEIYTYHLPVLPNKILLGIITSMDGDGWMDG